MDPDPGAKPLKRFFSPEAEVRIMRAIGEAESKSSGEIRVHLERHGRGTPMQRAEHVFLILGMNKTRDRNGVLIYLATEDHRFAILGDAGIDRVVPAFFWEEAREGLETYFKSGDFEGGIVELVRRVGEILETHFPRKHDDTNELKDEITYS
ncbi:TPM domain-containing protein [bacterium]|nr:TPM domain-containing protein [bacterium]